MNYKKNRTICFYALIVLLSIPFSMALVPIASAQSGLPSLYIMSPGSSRLNNFYIGDIFDQDQRGPIASTLIVALGENSDTLKITLQPKSTSKNFLFNVNYSIYGIAFSVNGELGLDNFIRASGSYYPNAYGATTSPDVYSLVQEIPVKSNFGFAVIGIIVDSAGPIAPDDPIPPFPFILKLALSKTAPPAAE
jgi:hypothetical protein